MLIPKSVFKISRIAPRSHTGRYTLGGVQVEQTSKGPIASATHQSYMVVAGWREDKNLEQQTGRFPDRD